MAGKACHVVGSATQVGLTQVLGLVRLSKGKQMATTMEKTRIAGALLVIFAGLVVIAFLAYMLPVSKDGWTPSDVIALVGALTTFLGTVIGAFLGVQAGSDSRERSDRMASRALAALPPEAASKIVDQEHQSAS